MSADAAVTARIFTSSPMWNITQPDSENRAEREQDSEEGEAGELQPDGREQAEEVGEREADGQRGQRDERCCAQHRDHVANR